MPTKRLARHNVVAAFSTPEDAERALEALGSDGDVPTDELSMLSREGEKAPGQEGRSESQGTGIGTAARAGVLGIGAGATTGGVLGALVGAAVTAIPGVGLAVGAGALYTGIAGAAVGHITGALIGAEAGARKTMMLEQSLQPMLGLVERGYVLVGVHTDDADRAEDAAQRLEDLEPVELARLEADETYHPPGTVDALLGQDIPSTHPDHPGGELGRDVEDRDARVGMEERGDSPTPGAETGSPAERAPAEDRDEHPDLKRPR